MKGAVELAFSEKVKKQVLRRAAFCCCACQSNMLSVEIHHIIPQKEGGSDEIENAAPLCPTCHTAFGNDPDKRKRIKDMRDWWYEIIEKIYPDNIVPIKKLDELHLEIKALRLDRDSSLEDLKVKFPFLKTGQANSRPALFIRLTCHETGQFQDTTGIIDSGAARCCAPASFAEILGMNLTAGVHRSVRTAGGEVYGYEHDCALKIWNTNEIMEDNKVVEHEFANISFIFMPSLKEVLLGANFLDKFNFGVDFQHRVFWLD